MKVQLHRHVCVTPLCWCLCEKECGIITAPIVIEEGTVILGSVSARYLELDFEIENHQVVFQIIFPYLPRRKDYRRSQIPNMTYF
jgi:hypothetical protein